MVSDKTWRKKTVCFPAYSFSRVEEPWAVIRNFCSGSTAPELKKSCCYFLINKSISVVSTSFEIINFSSALVDSGKGGGLHPSTFSNSFWRTKYDLPPVSLCISSCVDNLSWRRLSRTRTKTMTTTSPALSTGSYIILFKRFFLHFDRQNFFLCGLRPFSFYVYHISIGLVVSGTPYQHQKNFLMKVCRGQCHENVWKKKHIARR